MSDRPWGPSGDLQHLAELAIRLGYSDGELGHLQEAVTHTSFANEALPPVPHNERLEFLGDAVLDLVVAETLMAIHRDLPEGDLSRMRASLVSSRSLAEIGRELGLGSVLRLGRGEVRTGGRLKDSLMADAYEAMIGALYVDHGLEAARRVIEMNLGERMQSTSIQAMYRDYKTTLQEWCQAARHETPRYTVIHEDGPDHEKVFTVEVIFAEGLRSQGVGRSKKEAERGAAQAALDLIEQAAKAQ